MKVVKIFVYFIVFFLLSDIGITEYCDMDGWKLYYEKEGTGEKIIIFVHGNTGSLNYWVKIRPYLPKDLWTSYFIDLQGFGKSDNYPPYTIDEFSNTIVKFVKKMNFKKYIIVAHSLGGLITLNAIVKKNLKPEKVVLVNTAPADGYSATDEQVSSGFQFLMQNKNFLANSLRASLGLSDYKLLEQLVEDAIRAAPHAYTEVPKSWANTVIIDKLKNVKCPVLFIHGEWDNIISLDWIRATVKAIKKSKLVVMEGVFHAPMLQEPEKFVEIVKDFVK